ncbi:MAG: hypothetical protein HY077_06635 [Elusimicrobia bacterium]|nr:hypothetical protein [Elusimicrobiota bacterium]
MPAGSVPGKIFSALSCMPHLFFHARHRTLVIQVSITHAFQMERKVREAALGLRAAEEAQAKITRAGMDAQRDARQILGAVMGGSGARDFNNAAIEEASRELKEAQAAVKAATKALRAADKNYKEASTEWEAARARVEKAWSWEKTAAQAHEKEARQSVEAASSRHHDAQTAYGAARERLEAAQDKALARSREAEARSAETARLEKFQGTKESVAKAAKTASEAGEAARTLNEARVAQKVAHQGFEAERHRYDDIRLNWDRARSRVWEAGERVRTARLWEKKEARAAEQEAHRKFNALEKSLKDVRAARDEALRREQAASEMVKAAEASRRAAQTRAAAAARINELQATQQALRERADLSPAEQHRVAEYLGRATNATILRDCENPKQAIAAGLIASSARNATEATKGMDKSEAAKVVAAVEHNRKIETERGLENGRDKGKDHGLGFSL